MSNELSDFATLSPTYAPSPTYPLRFPPHNPSTICAMMFRWISFDPP